MLPLGKFWSAFIFWESQEGDVKFNMGGQRACMYSMCNIYIYMYTCVYIHIYIHHTYIYICKCICFLFTFIHMCIYIYMREHNSIYICTCIYAYSTFSAYACISLLYWSVVLTSNFYIYVHKYIFIYICCVYTWIYSCIPRGWGWTPFLPSYIYIIYACIYMYIYMYPVDVGEPVLLPGTIFPHSDIIWTIAKYLKGFCK